MNKYNLISLFSGAMGLDIGLERAGFECVLAMDNNKYVYNTILKNIKRLKSKDIKVLHDDIRNYNGKKILELINLRKKDIFCISGGPPCQAFSSAGKRLGLEDERGNVFIKFIEIINEISPPYIIIENVRGILSTVIKTIPKTPYKIEIPENLLSTKHGLILLLKEQLEKIGYSISFTLYNTAKFGVPQVRERVVILGHKGKTIIPLLEPTHFEDRSPHYVTLRQAIGDLDEKEMRYLKFPNGRIKYYSMLKEGENWRNLPIEYQKEALGNSYHLGGGKTGFYRRLSWDKPSPTLITSPSNFPATDLCHPTQLRPLSIEEYKRIQQFPDDWEFEGSINEIYKQIGNAVPVGFGEQIGKHIIDFQNNKRKYIGNKLENNKNNHSRYKNTDYRYYEKLKNQLSFEFI